MSSREPIGGQDNVYYEVSGDDELFVWCFTGEYKETNYHFGGSRLSRAVYDELMMRPGDQIHWLVGGMFFLGYTERGFLQMFEGRLDKPDPEKDPFERPYGDPYAERRALIARLIADGKIKQITSQEAIPVETYRRTT